MFKPLGLVASIISSTMLHRGPDAISTVLVPATCTSTLISKTQCLIGCSLQHPLLPMAGQHEAPFYSMLPQLCLTVRTNTAAAVGEIIASTIVFELSGH